jgi:hypothetical protein
MGYFASTVADEVTFADDYDHYEDYTPAIDGDC